MPEIDGSSKPPQISEMFQKFAIAFKTKTIEFFADEDETATATTTPAATDLDSTAADGFFTLLDSADEFITDQKVVVIKPDQAHRTSPIPSPIRPVTKINTQVAETLTSSLFAMISSFEASYLQLQTAHAPYDEEAIKTADKSLVSHLQKLSDLRQWYRNHRRAPDSDLDCPIGSCLEAQVQENQNKLRSLETVFNRLESEIDDKDATVSSLRQSLDQIQKSNAKLSKKLVNSSSNSNDIVLTIRVFDSMLREACRSLHSFTKLLIELMKKAKWDLDLAANSVHSGIDYAKRGHNRYAFLSYVSLCMFRGFDSDSFGLDVDGIVCNGDNLNSGISSSLKQLIEHVMCNPMDVLSKNPNCVFSRFCEKKYQQLIHPTMESSIFINLDRNEVVLSSWKSLSAFYESFVKMASSIWLLHKLAFLFNPAVEIFQVERGVDYSMVFMEDVTRKGVFPGKSRPKVGFTVIPGFKIGKTVIQSQVYLMSLKCTE